MAGNIVTQFSLQLVLTSVFTFTYGFSSSPSLSSDSSTSSSSLNFTQEKEITCQKLSVPQCSSLYHSTKLPNAYGHYSQKEAGVTVNGFLQGRISNRGGIVNAFVCVLYLPPCSEEVRDRIVPLPCRSMCEEALRQDPYSGHNWPVGCHVLPSEHCYTQDGSGSVVFTQQSLKPAPSHVMPRPEEEIASFAPLDVELGNNEEGYEVEVVSLSANHVSVRRYDIADLGDPQYFRGWADVQGTGSANDYCRVIGKSRRRFLSCNLAGSTGQGHHYVSKLGFDAGFNSTWFMRDMDGDGRDDYCRCNGSKHSSKVTCMKAGEKGFYGSTTQGGSQYTFSLPKTGNCHSKTVNPWFGE